MMGLRNFRAVSVLKLWGGAWNVAYYPPSTSMHSYRPAYHHVVTVVRQHSHSYLLTDLPNTIHLTNGWWLVACSLWCVGSTSMKRPFPHSIFSYPIYPRHHYWLFFLTSFILTGTCSVAIHKFESFLHKRFLSKNSGPAWYATVDRPIIIFQIAAGGVILQI
jgi:hypothetical protein